MISWRRWGLAVGLIFGLDGSSRAAERSEIVLRATRLLEEVAANPDSGIPPEFLREAQGIMIIPHMVDTQLGVGLKRGHGVVLIRDPRGGWGDPEPVEFSKASAGAEAGRQIIDVIAIYRSRAAADRARHEILAVDVDFGASARLARPTRFQGPKADRKGLSETIHYSRKSGILVGLRLGVTHDTAGLPPAQGPKRSGDAGPTHAETGPAVAKIESKGEPSPLGIEGRSAPRSADEIKLKAVVSAMTTPPAAPVAGPAPLDPMIRVGRGPDPTHP